jgi:hypothetical protein
VALQAHPPTISSIRDNTDALCFIPLSFPVCQFFWYIEYLKVNIYIASAEFIHSVTGGASFAIKIYVYNGRMYVRDVFSLFSLSVSSSLHHCYHVTF